MTPGQCRDKLGRKWAFVVGDDRSAFASLDGGEFWRLGSGLWSSGFSAMCESSDDPALDGLIVVMGRGTDGQLWQMLVYTDGGPPSPDPDSTVVLNAIGGHIYPPG